MAVFNSHTIFWSVSQVQAGESSMVYPCEKTADPSHQSGCNEMKGSQISRPAMGFLQLSMEMFVLGLCVFFWLYQETCFFLKDLLPNILTMFTSISDLKYIYYSK